MIILFTTSAHSTENSPCKQVLNRVHRLPRFEFARFSQFELLLGVSRVPNATLCADVRLSRFRVQLNVSVSHSYRAATPWKASVTGNFAPHAGNLAPPCNFYPKSRYARL